MGNRLISRVSARVMAAALFVALVCAASVAFAATVEKGTLRAPHGTERVAPSGEVGAATAGIDSQIPGTELDISLARTTYFAGDLAAGFDKDDVHAAYLYAGEVVTVTVNASSSTDFGLAVFGPWCTDIFTDSPVASAPPYFYGGPDAYPIEVNFKVPVTGNYYVDVWTWTDTETPGGPYDGGTGPYDLSLTIERAATGLMIFPQPTLSYMATATIEGLVYSRFVAEVPEGDVLLSISLNGFNYWPVVSQSLTDGGFYFTSIWPMKAYYQVQFEGTAIDGPSAEDMTVNMRASLARPSASRYGTRSYTLSGVLRPYHTTGTTVVRVYLWRSVNGHWKAAGYRNAKASAYGYDSKYSVRYKFPYKGKWRLQAYHSDSGHATTRSSYTYLTVR
jgi:hypothetical protein